MLSSEAIAELWSQARLTATDKFDAPPVILRVGNSIIGTLGNFSASTGKAKSKKTFNVCAIVAAALSNGTVLRYVAELPDTKRKILYVDTEQSPFHCGRILNRIIRLAGLPQAEHPDNLEFLVLRRYTPSVRAEIIRQVIYNTEGLGLVVIDGIRDLAYDINSPSEATTLISSLMQWTDERQIHIHTVLHLNKGDDNTRGHLGTELNNKAETILQVTKDDFDRDISTVQAMCIRDMEFDPFAFRINDDVLPELIEEYSFQKSTTSKSFDYHELSTEQHREALTMLFTESGSVSYSKLITALRKSYADVLGCSFGENKVKSLKTFLENKRMILKEGKSYYFNPDFSY